MIENSTSIYLFKVNNGNTRILCEISSKVNNKKKTEFKVNNKDNRKTFKDVVRVSLLLTLNRFYTLLWCFHCCWLWTSKCRLKNLSLYFAGAGNKFNCWKQRFGENSSISLQRKDERTLWYTKLQKTNLRYHGQGSEFITHCTRG